MISFASERITSEVIFSPSKWQRMDLKVLFPKSKESIFLLSAIITPPYCQFPDFLERKATAARRISP